MGRTSVQEERELSQKIIKMRVRDVSTKKRIPLLRETLIPKTIQFEGLRLDGKMEYNRNANAPR